MISYAQNGEDVVLARLFDAQSAGVWIDVGAGHPVDDSVTNHLSQRGWWGVNIEPHPALHALLVRERRRDLNLAVAASDGAGQAELHAATVPGRSTLRGDLLDGAVGPWEAVTVTTRTVASIVDEHRLDAIDLLKVDAEGWEEQVLRGCDLARIRPRVVVVEATEPGTARPSHDAWEPLLAEAGYRCALFDGLNRFYAAGDDTAALTALAAPASVLDEFEPWAWRRRVEEAAGWAHSLEGRVGELERQLQQLQREVAVVADEAEAILDP